MEAMIANATLKALRRILRATDGGNRKLAAPEGLALDEIGHLGDLVAKFTGKGARKPAGTDEA